jgi:hypothetical protein
MDGRATSEEDPAVARASNLLALLLALTACTSTGPRDPRARDTAAHGRPRWTEGAAFVEARAEGGVVLHGVGSEAIDGLGERCVETRLVVERASTKARVELAKLAALATSTVSGAIASTTTSTDGATTTRAILTGAETTRAWFDGEGTVFVLVSMALSAAAPSSYPEALRGDAPSGGAAVSTIPGAVARANRAKLEASGACADPRRREALPCCGPLDTFCADPTRFDHRPTADTCACGAGAPCLHDYRCEVRGGAPRCLCRGESCPCAELECRDGQTCEDARCF